MFNPLVDEKCAEYFESIQDAPNRSIIPFVVCGDLNGLDADKNYPLEVCLVSQRTAVCLFGFLLRFLFAVDGPRRRVPLAVRLRRADTAADQSAVQEGLRAAEECGPRALH